MTKDLYKQAQTNDIDIGGMGCNCCFDRPNKKKSIEKRKKKIKTKN